MLCHRVVWRCSEVLVAKVSGVHRILHNYPYIVRAPFLDLRHSSIPTIPFIRIWVRIARHIHWRSILSVLYITLTILYSASRRNYRFQVCRPPAKGLTTKMHRGLSYNCQQSTSNHMIQCRSVVDSMIPWLEWFARLPTILMYILLTWIHRICSVLPWVNKAPPHSVDLSSSSQYSTYS